MLDYYMYYIYRITVTPLLTLYYLFKLRRVGRNVELKDNLLLSSLKLARQNIPFYKDVIVDNSLGAKEQLKSFPVLTRSMLKKQSNDFVNEKYRFYRFFNTSGTSGDPLAFYRSANLGAVDAAHQINTYMYMGYKFGDTIVSFSGVQPSERAIRKGVYWKKNKILGQFPFGSIAFSSNNLNAETVSAYLEKINEVKPAIIRGYPSSVYSFFKLMEQGNLCLVFEIKAIQLTSENILPYQVEFIEKFTSAKVFRQYGHTECAMYAVTGKLDDRYQFSSYYGYLEVLDEKGEHVALGGVGRVVVTGFHNKKQPFIRYDTGDLARYSGEIAGVQYISDIAGRAQDYFTSNDGAKIPITSIVSGSHLSINEHVTLWKIIQKKPGELIVSTLRTDTVPQHCLNELTQVFKDYADLAFVKVEFLPLSNSGKFKFFEKIGSF